MIKEGCYRNENEMAWKMCNCVSGRKRERERERERERDKGK